MSDLDDQRRKRPGNRARIDQIKAEMCDETYQFDTQQHTLRDRIAAVLADADGMPWHDWSKSAQDGYLLRADAVIAELGLRRETTYAWRNGRTYPAGTRYSTRWERS